MGTINPLIRIHMKISQFGDVVCPIHLLPLLLQEVGRLVAAQAWDNLGMIRADKPLEGDIPRMKNPRRCEMEVRLQATHLGSC